MAASKIELNSESPTDWLRREKKLSLALAGALRFSASTTMARRGARLINANHCPADRLTIR